MQHMVFTPLLTCGTWCSPHCSLAAHGVHPTAHLQHMVFTPLLICGTWCSHHCSLAAHGVHPTAHLQHMVFTPLLTSTCVGTLEPQAAAVHITDIQPYLFKVHHIALAP